MFKKKGKSNFQNVKRKYFIGKEFFDSQLDNGNLNLNNFESIMKCVIYLFHNKNFRLFKIYKKIYIHNAEVLLSERLLDKIWAWNYFEALPKGRGKKSFDYL